MQQLVMIIEPDGGRSSIWQANLRIFEIEKIKSLPYTPTSHPFVERLIGTIRQEYLDKLFFWNKQDLERKLASFAQYYNQNRAHQSLNGHTPDLVSSTSTLDAPCLINLLGLHTAIGYFSVKSRHEFVMCHAQDNPS